MNFGIPYGQPLYRPAPQQDEWSETYLFRVARANGTNRPRLSDIERIRPTLAATATSKPDGYPVWGDSALPRWSVVTRVNKIRYCPQCMMESRYIRSRWRLTRLEVCTIHDVRLKDDLAEPVMTRGYKQADKYFVTEVTDEQLWEGAVCPMPIERRHHKQLWSGFERLITANKVPEAFVQLTYVLFLEALFDAIAAAVGEAEYQPVGVTRSTRIADLIERHQLSFEPSLEGIRTFLQQITGAAQRMTILARLRRTQIDESHRPTCLSKLPISELRRQYSTSTWPNNTVPLQDFLARNRDLPRGYISVRGAASHIGCSYGLLMRVVKNDLFPGARIASFGSRRQTYLPPQAVAAYRRWYASLVRPQHVLSEFHLEHRGYAVLLCIKLLHPFSVDGDTFFRRSDFNDICQKLDDVSRPAPPGHPQLYPLFGDWMSWRPNTKAASLEVVKEALSGKVPTFKKLDSPGLSAYFVDRFAIERLRKLRRIESARRMQMEHMPTQLSLLP
ncbi:tniQ family protein [Burkholderia pseudomallei MSHR1328]|nr:tniQ family protein [Burkholderia pseudomallei MSHR1357]KKC14020.1 tniQ family protein [Burkholderia pseudomallei MSHR1328]